MARNLKMRKAYKEKNDEFYTRKEDIEAEIWHYRDYFKDKVIYCNCDDPEQSEFYKHFKMKFHEYGLKELITTCYRSQNSDLFTDRSSDYSIALRYNGKRVRKVQLKGDGDFRSEECVKLLKKADIVVTNPPFSLFRELLAQLIEHDKKFLILGNMNTVLCKEVFPLFKENKCWYGVKTNGNLRFNVPEYYPLTGSQSGIDEKGNRYVTVPAISWYTNLNHEKRNDRLTLWADYDPVKNPTYTNYDAIEVSKTAEIPCNYDGIMGVPISFMSCYNPDQFEIVGIAQRNQDNPLATKVYSCQEKKELAEGNNLNASAVLKEGNKHRIVYARILIRRKS